MSASAADLPLRIAIAGASAMGRNHIEVTRRSDSCTLCAVVDPSPVGESVAREAGVPHLPALEALLAGERPYAVIVVTQNTLHAEQAIACLGAGIPVLVEKPGAGAARDAFGAAGEPS